MTISFRPIATGWRRPSSLELIFENFCWFMRISTWAPAEILKKSALYRLYVVNWVDSWLLRISTWAPVFEGRCICGCVCACWLFCCMCVAKLVHVCGSADVTFWKGTYLCVNAGCEYVCKYARTCMAMLTWGFGGLATFVWFLNVCLHVNMSACVCAYMHRYIALRYGLPIDMWM